MSLRDGWKTAKGAAELAFKQAHAKEMLKVHTDGMTPYPLKFKEDLGPTLDDYEKAVKAKKPAGAAKHASKSVIKNYGDAIDKVEKALGALPAKVLRDELVKIEGKLK